MALYNRWGDGGMFPGTAYQETSDAMVENNVILEMEAHMLGKPMYSFLVFLDGNALAKARQLGHQIAMKLYKECGRYETNETRMKHLDHLENLFANRAVGDTEYKVEENKNSRKRDAEPNSEPDPKRQRGIEMTCEMTAEDGNLAALEFLRKRTVRWTRRRAPRRR